ncbi:MAG: YbjQ family protein [Prochlorotrichaceae cyanobacterium]|jgi:uncharacterized protein YbjQ (UPF0145 family)
MLTTTTDVLQGMEIESYLGLVTAEVVYGTNALRDFFAGIRDMIGGRTGSYEQIFQKGQKEAIEELQQRAKRMGATGIIGVSLNTDSINVDEKGVLLLITATGTAVKIR